MDRKDWMATHRVTLDGGHVDLVMLRFGSYAQTERDFGMGLTSGYTVQDGRWLLYGQPFSGEVVDLSTGQPVAGACEPLLDPDGDYPEDAGQAEADRLVAERETELHEQDRAREWWGDEYATKGARGAPPLGATYAELVAGGWLGDE